VPIAQPKKKAKVTQQPVLFDEFTQDRIKENDFINQIRARVSLWRQGDYKGVTKTTRLLLDYWNNPQRHRKLFFCQIEALETAIYLTEVAPQIGDNWIHNRLVERNNDCNPDLFRVAFKLATGSGKTLVAAMIIAWQALNKLADQQNKRFSDAFLIVAPGIPVRDRLRVLLPSDPNNYYQEHDLVPADLLEDLGQVAIVVTNYHAFLRRERIAAGKLTKSILAQGQNSPFTETPDQMVRRVCRELGTKKNIVIINDEAHHCYRNKPNEVETLKGEDLQEAKKRNEEAHTWITGVEAVKAKMGVKVVYDLSATPFFLRGSGYDEGTLFPWVVSDFSLIDAIESGITKIPRVPVSDNAMTSELPTYRYFWPLVREDLPKKVKKAEMAGVEPRLPAELEGALYSLYRNYERYYHQWDENNQRNAAGMTPPVFIVVCNNTTVSKMLYDWISGWERTLPDDSTRLVPGKLSVFSNVNGEQWTQRPNTILVDSEQLQSGETLSDDFKQIASREIEEFKVEYRRRFPGRDAEELTDEDLLREVMNTVGKPGKLGEGVKCVVSVSMLTEGWDANTVTHIMGVRAFGTQLLCEQVVGRALRRVNYAVNDDGMLEPEYAEVYGVPFSFIPTNGETGKGREAKPITRVRAMEDRIACEIEFPRLVGYRYDLPVQKLEVAFTDESRLALSTADLPTVTENAPIVGDTSIHTLDDLKEHRLQEVAFLLAKVTLEQYFREDGDRGVVKSWFFPQLLDITRCWLNECVTCKDGTFPQLLLLTERAYDAADLIHKTIVRSTKGEKTLKPILRPHNTIGSTRYVDFDTTKPVYVTNPDKCHISHVVADTQSWEQKMAQVLEDMPEVMCYAKNQGLNFTIPYTFEGQEHNYTPDFIVRVDDDQEDPLNLIVEVSGQKLKQKAAKVSTAHTLWVPAINNYGKYGRWSFVEISDPWDGENTIRAVVRNGWS